MTSLHRHLTIPAGRHSGLPFRADCPLCARRRAHGQPPPAELIPQRPAAALAAALTLASATPAPALAGAELPPAGDVPAGGADPAAAAYANPSQPAGDETAEGAPEPFAEDNSELPPSGATTHEETSASGGEAAGRDASTAPAGTAENELGVAPAAPAPAVSPPATGTQLHDTDEPLPAQAAPADMPDADASRPRTETPAPTEPQAKPTPPAHTAPAAATAPNRQTETQSATGGERATRTDRGPSPRAVEQPDAPRRDTAGREQKPAGDSRGRRPAAAAAAAGAPWRGRFIETDAEQPERRPQGRQRPADPDASVRHVVRPNESLWLIAERQLGSDPPIAAVAREVNRLWQLNRQRLHSGNPDLIYPGEELEL